MRKARYNNKTTDKKKDLISTFENGLLKLYEFDSIEFLEKYMKEGNLE